MAIAPIKIIAKTRRANKYRSNEISLNVVVVVVVLVVVVVVLW